MSDFSTRLRALAQDAAAEHATGPGLALDDLARRARARRAARAVWTAGAAAVVVVGVGVGALALDRTGRAPQPADTPSVTATPAPSATPTPTPTPSVALPAGDASRPFGECGSLVGSPTGSPVDETLVLEAGDLPTTLAAGAPLPFRVSLGADSERTLLRPAAGPRVVVTHDDVVVAVTDVYGGARTDWVAQAGWTGVAQHVGDVPLVVCDAPGADVGVPLPASVYAVWFVGEGALTDDDLSGDVTEPDAGLRRSVVLGPRPLTVTGTAVAVTPPAAGVLDATAPGVPAGQAAPPSAPTVAGPWRFTHAVGPLDLAAADLVPPDGEELLTGRGLDVSGTLTHVGPGRATLHADVVVAHWLVQDGRVVATTYLPTDAYTAEIDLGPGHGTTLRSPATPAALCLPDSDPDVLCTAEGGPVPPGRYTLLPGVVVHGGTLWRPEDGVRGFDDLLGADGPYVVLGEPVPLTLR